MLIVDDLGKNGAVAALALGVMVVLLAPVVVPVVLQIGRPVIKGAIKGGLLCLERGREAFAQVGEIVEDTLAEARAEMGPAKAGAAAAPGVPGTEAGTEAGTAPAEASR